MRSLAALVTLTLACAGASPAPRTPRVAAPELAKPTTGQYAGASPAPRTPCPESPPVTCPDCPVCPVRYSDRQGWYCIDDPATKGRNREYSYCWFKREDCEHAHELIAKKRPTVKPCRPHAPAYCYDKYSTLLQVRRSECAATMDHCERLRVSETKEVLPEEGYVFSPCTEQP